MEDRRESSRTSADWPVKVTIPENSMEGEVRNVSSTGAFIHCEKPLNARERCLLIIELPRFGMQKIQAEVVWSIAAGADDESRPWGMAVRFLW